MKKRFCIVSLAVISCALLTFGLSACRGKIGGVILETPENLRITDEYLTWDEVSGAEGYIVEVNGEERRTATNC